MVAARQAVQQKALHQALHQALPRMASAIQIVRQGMGPTIAPIRVPVASLMGVVLQFPGVRQLVRHAMQDLRKLSVLSMLSSFSIIIRLF